jgi:hypothetical protein
MGAKKLTDEQVKEIRERNEQNMRLIAQKRRELRELESQCSLTALSKEYGISTRYAGYFIRKNARVFI